LFLAVVDLFDASLRVFVERTLGALHHPSCVDEIPDQIILSPIARLK
jgi:hypothetical protein